MNRDARGALHDLSAAIENRANSIEREYPGRVVATFEGLGDQTGEPIVAFNGVEGLAQRTAKTFLEIANAIRIIAESAE